MHQAVSKLKQGKEVRTVYAFEQQIRVMLEFRAMEAPVEISVPWNVLRYLDTHADRYFAPDGTVIYRHRGERSYPVCLTSPLAERAMAAA
jgi:hypothetical protein